MRTSLNIPFQLPDYVVEKYPKFVEFIQAYYEYFATQQIDLATAKDAAVTDLLDNIAAEYAPKLNLNNLTEKQKRLVLTKIVDLYKSKGSSDSIKFLLAVMYGADSDIILPSEFIFKPSAAKWNRDISVRFRITSGLLDSFGGFEASIAHDGIVSKVNVVRIERISANFYEAFIESKFKLNIVNGGVISTSSFSGNLEKSTVGYKVLVPGSGFRVGDIFTVVPPVESGAPTRIRIKRINNESGIRHIEFVKFGYGFGTDFQYQIYAEQQINSTPNNLSIQVIGANPLSVQLPSDDAVNTIKERLLMAKYTYFQSYNYTLNPTYVGALMADATSTTNSQLTVSEGGAIVTFFLGYVLEYPGYYSTNVGFTSDSSYLQDGDYYQQFSYVIKTDRQLEEFGSVVKELVHPAGLKMFGEYSINNQVDIFIEIENILNAINTAYIDTALVKDTVSSIAVIKNLVENVNVLADYVINLQKGTITDNIQAPDSPAISYTKLLQEVQGIAESIDQKILNKNIEDNISTGDFSNRTVNKTVANLAQVIVISDYENDDVFINVSDDILNVGGGFTLGTAGDENLLLTDEDFLVDEDFVIDEARVRSSGGVILNPYYSSADLVARGVPYWSFGYTVNERKI